MHIDKYKSWAIKNMINHYERGSEAVLNRDNIDRTRTHLNWQINNTHDLNREVHSAMSKKKFFFAIIPPCSSTCQFVVSF